jgi:predicted permease
MDGSRLSVEEGAMLSDFVAGLREAARTLRKNPGFTFTALVTLALAIGANSAIFTLANALLLVRLPVSQPGRLFEISTLDPKGEKGKLSMPAFQLIQQQAGIFTSALAWRGGAVENLEMNRITFVGLVDGIGGDYYATLGIRPALGRFITREDIGLEHPRVAVIAYRDWQERYSSDPGVIGKTILIDGEPYTIVGVHPKSFPGLIRENAADATIPFDAETLRDRKNAENTVIGRLRDGIDPTQARARLEGIWPLIRQATMPDDAPEHDSFLARRIQIDPAASGISYLRDQFMRPLYILLGIVALLLLLACVNLANVALARAHGRAAELSLRAALGASRWRLIGSSLTESFLLAIGGAVPGLAFAYWGSNYIAHLMWQGFTPLVLSFAPDARIVLFTVVVTVSAGTLFGLLPAWRAGRQDPAALIRRGNPRVAGGLGAAGRTLVITQIALSFAILAGALLFSRGLGKVLQRDPGFSRDRLLVAQLFPRTTYRGFDMPAYSRQLLESLRAITGVTAAALAASEPAGPVLPANVSAAYRLVVPGFFDTVGMRILRGRDFTMHDDETRPLAAIVSAKLARLISPSGDALGQRVRVGDLKGEFTIEGIASDATLDDPRTPNAPVIYVPMFQHPGLLEYSKAILRTPGDPARLARAFRERIESLGREYPLRIQTIKEQNDAALLPERMLMLLTGFFGAAGLLLAGVGLFGLLAYTISRRTGEIGIRMALGATPGAIVLLVLRDVAVLVAVGLAAGLAIAFAGARAITAFLYGLSSHDPATLALAAGVLVFVAILTSLIPAVRAIRIDPVGALHYD